MTARARWRALLPWVAPFLLGLVLRLFALPRPGMFDMQSYFEWGERSTRLGLVQAYHGIYFPLQWQIFQIDALLAGALGGSVAAYVVVFKATNLLFDVGILYLLVRMLERRSAAPSGALVYWLHPWFLVVFFQGYVDAQFSFFALWAADLAERGRTFRDHLLAGIPLGLAFVMKPQAQALLLAAALAAGLDVLRRRDWRASGFVLPSVLIFALYALLFQLRGGALSGLIATYARVADVMPALSAQALNVWYPLAWLLAPAGQPVWAVQDTFVLAGPISARTVAVGGTLAALALLPLAARGDPPAPQGGGRFTPLFAWTALVLPMLMTCAHENHLFLGSVFLVLLLPGVRHVAGRAAIHVLLLLQALNLLALYGLGQAPRSGPLAWLGQVWAGPPAVAASVLACACFVFIVPLVFGAAGVPLERWRRWLPAAILGGAVGAVYLFALAGPTAVP